MALAPRALLVGDVRRVDADATVEAGAEPAMPYDVEKLLLTLPDGACVACLSRRAGCSLADVESVVDRLLTLLQVEISDAHCPECGEPGRVVRLR